MAFTRNTASYATREGIGPDRTAEPIGPTAWRSIDRGEGAQGIHRAAAHVWGLSANGLMMRAMADHIPTTHTVGCVMTVAVAQCAMMRSPWIDQILAPAPGYDACCSRKP